MELLKPLLAIFSVIAPLYGCTLPAGNLARYIQPTVSPTAENPAETSPQESGAALKLDPAWPALIGQPDEQDENLFAPLSLNLHQKTENHVTRNVVRQESREGAPKPQEQPTAVLPKAQEPTADDQLLNLIEKDLKKALEQPAERRRLQFSRAVIEHPRVRYFIRYFSKGQKEYFARALARSGKYFQMIAKVLREEGLPEELGYLALIESNFHPQASSPSGAVGLWQFIPDTARKYGLKIDAWVDERRDPVKSTRAAAVYLKDLHDYFGRWSLATAAYNAGLGTIERALQTSGAKDFWALSAKAKLRDETQNFVPKFVAASLIATDPDKYGFGGVAYEALLEYDEVEVRGNLRLASLAEMAGADSQTIQALNPELLRSQTPPGENGFRVKLPLGRGASFARAYQQRQETDHVAVVTHEVKKGETLFSIARRYGQEVRSLIDLNGLTSHRLRIGQKLMVLLEGLRGKLR